MGEKVRENLLRRVAARRGLRLRKSRRRDPDALDYGAFWLVDMSTNSLILGDEWGTSLEKIAEFLERRLHRRH